MNERASHRRKWIRLPEYDYRLPGAYFITICSHQMRQTFGTVVAGEMQMNAFGEIVRDEWLRTAEVRQNVQMDAFVVMPNHVHGILMITAEPPSYEDGTDSQAMRRIAGTEGAAPRPRGPAAGSVSAIVGQFKSHSARKINRLRNSSGAPVWKANFYEHIIRNDRSLDRIRDYIESNAVRWHEDRYYVPEAART